MKQGHRVRRALAGAATAALVALGAGGCTSVSAAPAHSAAASSPSSSGGKPNILYVLTDDLSWNLVKYMPHVRDLMKRGTTFDDFFVTDSLCCPSRTTILTGEFPHNTGVYGNAGPDGGYNAVRAHHDEDKCYAPRLQQAGYRTGFMGKYINLYKPRLKYGTSRPYVPPGWDEWDVAGNGYPEYNYWLNENHHPVHHGHRPKDYLTDVVSGRATKFIDSAAKAHKPFMLETATFAPHSPSTPAPRDLGRFKNLTLPKTSAFGHYTKNAPKWQKKLTPLTAEIKRGLQQKFRKRVRAVQAVDRMIGHLEAVLRKNGQADDTYIVFGSDNGFHLGDHQLRAGKMTAYDTDIKVPLMVAGPGVKAGARVSQFAQNTDMNPTFQQLAGLTPSPSDVDGRSLVGLLHGRTERDWRKAVLVEHHHENQRAQAQDPDRQQKEAGDPPSYNALRTAHELYVEYADGEREYYTPGTDPDETDNRIGSLSKARQAALHRELAALHRCKGAKECTGDAR